METIDKGHFIEVLEALHRDQIGLVESLNRVFSIVESYSWIAEGRGSYEYDDEEYYSEIDHCFNEIRTEINSSLNKSASAAHELCCGKYRHIGRHPKVPTQRRLRMGQFYSENYQDELMDLALLEVE